MRFATIVRRVSTVAAVLEDDPPFPIAGPLFSIWCAAGCPPRSPTGRRGRSTSRPVPLAERAFDAPLQPPTIRDFVTFEEHVEGVRASVRTRPAFPTPGTTPRISTSPTRTRSPDPTRRSSAPHGMLRPSTSNSRSPPSSAGAGTDLTVEEARGAHLRVHRPQRLVRPRPAKTGDAGGPRPGEGQGLRQHPRARCWSPPTNSPRSTMPTGSSTLACTAQVNGVEVGADVLSNMGWTFPALVAYASRDTRIEPGDVLGSGTVGNGGCLAELWGRRGRQDPPPLAAR